MPRSPLPRGDRDAPAGAASPDRPPSGEVRRVTSGTLFVVATPIGNLEDITLRALRILREVTLVAAEDTRRTVNLLRHYRIDTPLISVHEHNEHRRRAEIVERLQRGDSVALVSDAGTPGISDPGAAVVGAAREAGIRVEPIPGPSAVTAALSASGLGADRFVFAGFPPTRSKDRKSWLAWVAAQSDVPVVCFEAPHRVAKTLSEMRFGLGERPIIVARELTKAHETWTNGESEPVARGEFVIIIGRSTKILAGEETATGPSVSAAPTDAQIAEVFGEMTEKNAGDSRKAVIRAVATRLGLPANAVYAALERAKT